MSEIISGGTAVPNSINLAQQKPDAIQCYTRRVKSIATNAQTFTENAYVKIFLDTSVPGASIVPDQSYLSGTCRLINTNPFIDYVSFGTAGVASFIDEYRVYNQGTPIVETVQYNLLYEQMMNMNGMCRKPLEMFRSCNVSQGVEKAHSVNAIKPPMVSQQGNPMHYWAVSPSRVSPSSVWGVTNYNVTSNASIGRPLLLSTAAAGASIHKLQVTGPAPVNPTITTPQNQQPWVHPFVPLELPALTMGRMGIASPLGAAPTSFGAWYSTASGVLSNDQLTALGTNAYGNNSNCRTITSTVFSPTNYNGTNVPQTKVADLAMSSIGLYSDITDGQKIGAINGAPPALTLYGSTTYFHKQSATLPENPLNWPFVMPNDLSYADKNEPVNDLEDYMMFYSNVKNIPVGIIGQTRATAVPTGVVPSSVTPLSNPNFINVDELTTYNGSYAFQFSLPLICPLFGSLAEKCTPTMLMAPGSTYIEAKLALATKALQVSMDPCRRVFGTIRDFAVFGGSLGGRFGQFNYVNPFGDANTAATVSLDLTAGKNAAAMQASLVTNMQYLDNNVTAGSGTIQALAQTPWQSNAVFGIGSGVISNVTKGVVDTNVNDISTGLPPTNWVDVNNFTVTSRPFPTPNFACIGANLLPNQYFLSSASNKTGLSDNYDLIFSPYSVAAMNGNWTTYTIVDEALSTVQSSYGKQWWYTEVKCIPQPFAGSINTNGTQNTYAVSNALLVQSDTPAIFPNQIQSNIVLANNQCVPIYGSNVLNCQRAADPTNLNTIGQNSDVFGYYYSYDFGIPQTAFTALTADGTGSVRADSTPQRVDYGKVSFQACGSGRIATMNAFEPPTPYDFNTGANLTYGMGNTAILQEYTVMGHSAGVPLPQWFLVKQPWAKKNLFASRTAITGTSTSAYNIWGATIGISDIASETQACYGTFLEKSVAQAMRCFNAGNTSYVTYELSNMEYVAQQVIVPESVSAAILASAAQGDISIAATGIRTYQSQVNSSSSQNIIISAKIGSANAIYTMFQPQNYQAGTESQLYNSCSGMCPFSRILSTDPYPQTSAISVPIISSAALYSSGKHALGQSLPFTFQNTSAAKGSFKMQLMVGNEYIPQSPITSINEIVAELIKCQHKLFDTEARSDVSFNLVTMSGYTTGALPIYSYAAADASSNNSLYYDCLQDRAFCTAFSPASWLDDQTYIGNPNWNYIGACLWNLGAAADQTNGLYNTAPTSTSSLYGDRGAYTLPRFTPLECTFLYGTDLDTWSKYSNVARSGKFLGQNTIYLQMENAYALNYLSASGATTGITGINCYNFIPHDLRFSFQAGGSIVAFY